MWTISCKIYTSTYSFNINSRNAVLQENQIKCSNIKTSIYRDIAFRQCKYDQLSERGGQEAVWSLVQRLYAVGAARACVGYSLGRLRLYWITGHHQTRQCEVDKTAPLSVDRRCDFTAPHFAAERRKPLLIDISRPPACPPGPQQQTRRTGLQTRQTP